MYKVFFLGLKIGSIKPEWRPDDNLAPKILTILPLSPENNGIKVNNVGLDKSVEIELLNIPPANTPKIEQINNTGVDCLIIDLVSSDELNP